jgi:hypothetical protein
VQGPAAYNQCLRDQLATLSKGPRTPDLSGLSAEERQSIESACAGAKYVQGPAAYNGCLRDQIAALSKGKRAPDLSGLSTEERQSIESACAGAKYVQGPAAYNQCLRTQLASLGSAPGAPDLSELTTEERQSIESACAGAKYVQGPAAYNGCLRDQIAALSKGRRAPDLSGLSTEERQSIESACAGAKYVQGPAAYNRCLRDQLAALSQGPNPALTPSRPTLGTPVHPPPTSQYEKAIAPQPAFAWPNWAGGVSAVQLRPPARTNLEPAEVFKKVAPSVYAVLASASREQMLSGNDVSQGSAVAVSQQELITNCHVVEGTTFIIIIQKTASAKPSW